MNIHFDNTVLLANLKNNSIARVTVGSHMYGLDTRNSDLDILYIYLEDENTNHSFLWDHNQLQFKQQGTDLNFVSLQSFIRNALTGDSTINFETIFSDELKDTKLHWLWEHRDRFMNYNIIRAYLGFARRDLKNWNKDSKKGNKSNPSTNKKLSHFVRGIIFASNIVDKSFDLDLTNSVSMESIAKNDYELLTDIKNGTSESMFPIIIDHFENKMQVLRDDLNQRLNAKEIVSVMHPKHLKELDDNLKEFIKSYSTNHNLTQLDYELLFYSVLENGVVLYK